MIYFDANYLVRLYFDDRGFEVVRDLASQQPVVCSIHGRAEVVAAFHRKWREGAITQPFYATTLQQFAYECRAEAYRWIPLSPDILQRVEKYFATLPKSLFYARVTPFISPLPLKTDSRKFTPTINASSPPPAISTSKPSTSSDK